MSPNLQRQYLSQQPVQGCTRLQTGAELERNAKATAEGHTAKSLHSVAPPGYHTC